MTNKSETSGPAVDRDVEDLDEWWKSSPAVDLSRSDWSVILETLNEQASMDELGDHIDQMAARERRSIVARVKNQASIEPPLNLRQAAYHDDDDGGEGL